MEALRELATRGTSPSGTGSGKGAGARVAVRSVLEDHETAILELERVVEGLVYDFDSLDKVGVEPPRHRFQDQGHVSHDCRTWFQA